MKKNNVIILIINIIYFLSIVFFSRSELAYLLTQKNSIILSLLGCVYSLFAIFVSIKCKDKFRWLFLATNILLFLMYSYSIYFEIVIYNS